MKICLRAQRAKISFFNDNFFEDLPARERGQ